MLCIESARAFLHSCTDVTVEVSFSSLRCEKATGEPRPQMETSRQKTGSVFYHHNSTVSLSQQPANVARPHFVQRPRARREVKFTFTFIFSGITRPET